VRERIGVGIRALRRDRMLYRREIALRIDWRRDSVAQVSDRLAFGFLYRRCALIAVVPCRYHRCRHTEVCAQEVTAL
jgi:hypothetical protein